VRKLVAFEDTPGRRRHCGELVVGKVNVGIGSALPAHLGDARIGCKSVAVELDGGAGRFPDCVGAALARPDPPGFPIIFRGGFGEGGAGEDGDADAVGVARRGVTQDFGLSFAGGGGEILTRHCHI
jgi:hypothetical protein